MPINTIIDPTQFRDDVGISDTDIDIAFRQQASLFAHYASLQFEAQKQKANKKLSLELRDAMLDKEIRDRVAAESGKITEKAIETEIARDKRHIAALMEFNEADAVEALAKNALEAFKQRKDMLISLGANQRQERGGELRMKGEQVIQTGAGAGYSREEVLEMTRRSMLAATGGV